MRLNLQEDAVLLWTCGHSALPRGGLCWVNNACLLQMVTSLELCHMQWAFMDGTLLQRTPWASQDRNDSPHWTDEETDAQEVKLGRKSHGWDTESEFKGTFSRFQFQITKEAESPSGFPETGSVVLCIILGLRAFLCGHLKHCNHYSFGNRSQLKICWVNKKHGFLAKLDSWYFVIAW